MGGVRERVVRTGREGGRGGGGYGEGGYGEGGYVEGDIYIYTFTY